MPILPLIDLLILAGTSSLVIGFVLKALAITTRYHLSLFGFTSLDFVIISGICFGMALTLAARTWVKLNEPRLLVTRRARDLEGEARDETSLPAEGGALGGPPMRAEATSAERR